MNIPDQAPLLISIKDAAQSIGVCRATFYDLLNADCIESVKVGTRRLIVQESLIAYVEGLRKGGNCHPWRNDTKDRRKVSQHRLAPPESTNDGST